MKKIIIAVFLVFWQVSVVFSQTQADDLIGYYLAYDPKTSEKAQMEIYKTADEKYEVKTVWVENKSISHEVGTVQIRNLTYDTKAKEWKNGKVTYDGSEYRMTVSFTNDGRLKCRGFLGISLLGKTVYWIKENELRK